MLGPISSDIFVSLGMILDSTETPFAKTPFSWFLIGFLGEKKNKGNPPPKKGFSLRGTPKILGKERKNARKNARQKKKKQGNQEKPALEGQGN